MTNQIVHIWGKNVLLGSQIDQMCAKTSRQLALIFYESSSIRAFSMNTLVIENLGSWSDSQVKQFFLVVLMGTALVWVKRFSHVNLA